MKIVNDLNPFDPGFVLGSALNQIVWGFNHYPEKLGAGSCLVWIKRNEASYGTFLSDAEIAYKSSGHGVFCKKDLSNNSIANERVHPTQKPVSLMMWCMSFFPKTESVIDPFMGSGTTLRAAKDMGIKATGIEMVERYCEVAAERLRQGVLF